MSSPSHPGEPRQPDAFLSNAPSTAHRDASGTQSSTFRPRGISLSSDSSDSSRSAALAAQKRAANGQQPQRHPHHDRPLPPLPPLGVHSNASASSLNFSRPTSTRGPYQDGSSRQNSPATDAAPSGVPWHPASGHRRQRSQGYFEPTLPSASSNAAASNTSAHGGGNMAVDASRIAAQAAMGAVQHTRKRSMTVPDPNDSSGKGPRRRQSPPPAVPSFTVGNSTRQAHDGFSGGHKLAAATAANVVFPRSPGYSPGHLSGAPPQQQQQSHTSGFSGMSTAPEKEVKKEKSKMKLFSKPKSIGIVKDKDVDKKYALPSPNKVGGGMHSTVTLPRFTNASTTSLVDPLTSSASSIYSSANASTSTLVPSGYSEKESKEKHKHNFLSRSKNKHKEKDSDHYVLPLSSSSSTARPTDPNGPQPLYSFAAPSSPGPSSTFAKSVSGLDLRHGGRALREKKKEEKAVAASLLAPASSSNMSILSSDTRSFRERDHSFSAADRPEWPGPVGLGHATPHGQSPAATGDASISQPLLQHLAASFEMPGMGPDEAWPLLKARLLLVFEGGEPRPPVEDFNALVGVWLRRCIQLGNPTMVIEDLHELLGTGFGSMNHTLARIPDERLVPSLVDLWHMVFSTVLPFMQAVFLPLDLEFKGHGAVLTADEAAEKWGAKLPTTAMSRSASYDRPLSIGSDSASDASQMDSNIPVLGEDLDVRRIVLLTFRDAVVLPHIDTLMAIFSRLSLENLSSGLAFDPPSRLPEPPSLASLIGEAGPNTTSRPSTAPSVDPSTGSFSSSAGTAPILDSSLSSLSNIGARSRATSNTSAGSFGSLTGVVQHVPHHSHSNSLPHQGHGFPAPPSSSQQQQQQSAVPMDSAKVTEIVGRMLQCVSVLAGVQTGDDSQESMKRLARELKLNWLGRGRTGRQRRGFVGTKMPRTPQARGERAVEVR